MARRRQLHPDFFHDEHLVTMPALTRLLFAGLWCLADRDGKLEDRPVRIKMTLFPMDVVDVDAALDALQAVGMVQRYAVDGAKFLRVNKFLRYQHPHPSEAPSRIPDPPTGLQPAEGDPPGSPSNSARSENAIRPDENVIRAGAGYVPSDPHAFGSSCLRGGAAAGGPPRAPLDPVVATMPRRAAPLTATRLRHVVFEWRACVPAVLHQEFLRKLGGDSGDAEAALRAWYAHVAEQWPADQVIGDDDFAFWKARFREWQGATPRAVAPRRASDVGLTDTWSHYLSAVEESA